MSGRRLVALIASATLLAALLPSAALAVQSEQVGDQAGGIAKNGVYIVQMADQPVVAYTGGIKGYPATKPAAGEKIDPLSAEVVKYVTLLKSRHAKALTAVGGKKLYDYVYTYNGFAARMTPAQAQKMAARAGIVAVTPDEIHTIDTSSTPNFLGLIDGSGNWTFPAKGEGIIIGDVDSGIWPEALSFADRVDANGVPSSAPTAKRAYQQIPGWHGKCVPGEQFTATLCNQKLIGGQYFNASWGGNAGINAQRPWEFNSVRDYNGHGSHTASTAGGNYKTPTTGPAAVFGSVSGMAPRARIAAYKALWSTEAADTASGFTADLTAAIDRAVADGVDIITYSISGTLTNFRDPVEIAFMYAADAGIFVATSAGNSGPTTSTVAHPGPWLTTVAAGTHNRSALGDVTLGNGASYTGPSTSAAEVTAPIINATDAGLAGADPTKVALCYSSLDGGNVLDPAKVAGKIVVCDRGVTARVNKSLAVMEAGGVGMVLVNTSAAQSLNADFHSVPTVHLASTDRAPVMAYAATAGATATISKSYMDYETPAPYTANLSSRGPLQASGDLLKPDLIAPGQDILAAVSPASGGGLSFNLYSGTSMSTPHVAGMAALLMNLHPDWSPMMIKSALMTSGYDVLDGPPDDPVVIFREGAGHIAPRAAADPGLVFNSGWNDWLTFICNTQPQGLATTCNALWGMGYSKDASDLNVASIAIADLAGAQTVTRTVTNVGAEAETYNFAVTGLSGMTVDVSPATFTLAPGATQKLSITVTRTTAALNNYIGGHIAWTGDQGHAVRIPVVVMPVALAAPAQVSSNGTAINYNVTFGYTGSFSAAARGLVPATTFAGSINTGQQITYDVLVPAGTTYARFSLFDANVSPASDLDLYVYRGSTLVGSSGGGTSAEEVNLLNPAADTYTVLVDGYATGNPSTFTLFTWVLGSADPGNMTVTAPATAVLGQTGAINLVFTGLTAGTKYLGSVAYSGVAGMPNPTIVRVDP
jgi:Subtilase family/Fibronectin type-III domain/PA domain/Peptidase inhibitor I9